MALTDVLRARFYRWALRGRPPEPTPILLSQRRVYVLPTRAGLAYLLTAATMLIGAINYNLSLGHALVFLLLGIGVAAILNTFRNLAHLSVSKGRCPPVFAGGNAQFGLVLRNPRRFCRYNLTLRAGDGDAVHVDIPAEDQIETTLPAPARQRGWLTLPRVTLSTTYPLGLVRAWAYAAPDQRCLVYPTPASSAPPLPRGGGQGQERLQQVQGDDDFAGFRRHVPGEPMQRIAWKSAARQPDAELLAKHFAGESSETLWLDWAQLSPALDVEQRLSILTRWIIDAHSGGFLWGLRLPDCVLPPAKGDSHCHRSLEVLALYGTR